MITGIFAIVILVGLAFIILNLFRGDDMPRRRKRRKIFDNKNSIFDKDFRNDFHRIDTITRRLNRRIKPKKEFDMSKLMPIVMSVVGMGIVLMVGLVIVNEVKEELIGIGHDPTVDEYLPIPNDSQVLNTDTTNNYIGNENYTDTINKYKTDTFDNLDIIGTI